MPKNIVRRTFNVNGSWTCPAGVTQIQALLYRSNESVLEAGSDCVHFITPTGDLYGWGANTSGAVGDNSTTNRSSPVLVVGSRKWVNLGTGGSAHASGTVQNADLSLTPYGTGSAATGRLGTNDVTDRSSPSAVVGGIGARFQGGGQGGSFISLAGDAYTYGQNSGGQLGDNTIVNRSSPVLVVGGKSWLYLCRGNSSSAITGGVDSNNDAYAWGTNTNGAIGDNSTTNRSSPTLVVGGLKFSKLSCGTDFMIGLTTGGDLYGWGLNSSGQLGSNTTTNRSSPVLVVGGKKFVDVAAGLNHCVAIDTNGDAYTWGSNTAGQLGDNSTTSRSSPVLVIGGLKFSQARVGTAQAATGTSHAISLDGKVYCWGDNTAGYLGNNSTANQSSPVQIAGVIVAGQPKDILLNQVAISVTPGTVYSVTLFAQVASLGANIVGTNIGLTRMILEYKA